MRACLLACCCACVRACLLACVHANPLVSKVCSNVACSRHHFVDPSRPDHRRLRRFALRKDDENGQDGQSHKDDPLLKTLQGNLACHQHHGRMYSCRPECQHVRTYARMCAHAQARTHYSAHSHIHTRTHARVHAHTARRGRISLSRCRIG